MGQQISRWEVAKQIAAEDVGAKLSNEEFVAAVESRFALIGGAVKIEVEGQEERCPDCGHTPETGACYRCKMD